MTRRLEPVESLRADRGVQALGQQVAIEVEKAHAARGGSGSKLRGRANRISPVSSDPRVDENEENSPMSRSLRILAAYAVLAGLGACAAPPPPALVITAPPPKPLDAKTQLENQS
jgi:hypothetical protein